MMPSTFTKEDLDFVDRIEGNKIVLIDGSHLSKLTIEHNLVLSTRTNTSEEILNDFFDDYGGLILGN